MGSTAGLVMISGLVLGKGDMGNSLKDGSMWATDYQEVESWQGERMAWVEKDKKLRFVKPVFTLGDNKLGETLVEIESQRPSKLVVSVYNRGDDGSIGKEAFDSKLAQVKESLDTIFGMEGKVYRPPVTKTAVKIDGYMWKNEKTGVLLEYSISIQAARNFKAEFIRITFVPADQMKTLVVDPRKVGMSKEPLKKSQIKAKVEKTEDGDVFIRDVPMVDQGQKGYCAVATTTRVLEYYGFDNVDQHEVAQIAKTTDQGTSPDMMMKGIARVLPSRFGLNVKSDIIKQDIEDLVKKYNREAKKAKADQIVFPRNAAVIYVDDIWKQFEPEILKETRAGNKNLVNRWMTPVKSYIDQGIPVMWGMMIGILPESEKLPQSTGGHMRLILGYNLKTGEIIFSDSWGAGHEKKRMPVEQAVTITTGMYAIIPRS